MKNKVQLLLERLVNAVYKYSLLVVFASITVFIFTDLIPEPVSATDMNDAQIMWLVGLLCSKTFFTTMLWITPYKKSEIKLNSLPKFYSVDIQKDIQKDKNLTDLHWMSRGGNIQQWPIYSLELCHIETPWQPPPYHQDPSFAIYLINYCCSTCNVCNV